jgi:23S rRNA U2552 (ribose-2'-O)-methylase RlmE/FtsJ
MHGSLNPDGLVIAVDLAPLRPLFEPPGCKFIQGDILAESTLEQIRALVAERYPRKSPENAKVDAVISDMAPHSSGVEVSDRVKQVVS